jgi:uncharacterized protein YlaN (UPF0358 family)
MKITRRQLRKLIKEELNVLNEDWTFATEKDLDSNIQMVTRDIESATKLGHNTDEDQGLLDRLNTAKKKGKYPVTVTSRDTRS